MRHTYIYGLMISLIVLASCTKKPVHHIHHAGSSHAHTDLPPPASAVADSTQDAPPPPPKASWLHGASEAGIYRTGNPYKVNGVWHFPQKELDPNHDEIGEATWYGHDFHNKMTANGEIFDMHGFTAAHKTLPLPSVVRVTNLSNKKSVILRVNDRGPFDNKRVIDVSKKAAELLGFLDQGTAKVRVQVLPEESIRIASMAKGSSYNPQKLNTQENSIAAHLPAAPIETTPPAAYTNDMSQPTPIEAVAPPGTPEPILDPPSVEILNSLLPETEGASPATEQPTTTNSAATTPIVKGTTYIQAGAYRNKANAENAVKKLQKVAPAELSAMGKGPNPLYRVRVGPFPHKNAAHQKLKHVVALGHPDATVVG